MVCIGHWTTVICSDDSQNYEYLGSMQKLEIFQSQAIKSLFWRHMQKQISCWTENDVSVCGTIAAVRDHTETVIEVIFVVVAGFQFLEILKRNVVFKIGNLAF